MLDFEDMCRLHLRGDGSQPMVYVVVAVFGNCDHQGFGELSLAIARLFLETLDINPANVFIKYDDIECWSVSGRTFDGGRK